MLQKNNKKQQNKQTLQLTFNTSCFGIEQTITLTCSIIATNLSKEKVSESYYPVLLQGQKIWLITIKRLSKTPTHKTKRQTGVFMKI